MFALIYDAREVDNREGHVTWNTVSHVIVNTVNKTAAAEPLHEVWAHKSAQNLEHLTSTYSVPQLPSEMSGLLQQPESISDGAKVWCNFECCFYCCKRYVLLSAWNFKNKVGSPHQFELWFNNSGRKVAAAFCYGCSRRAPNLGRADITWEQNSPGRAEFTWENRYVSPGRTCITWVSRYHQGSESRFHLGEQICITCESRYRMGEHISHGRTDITWESRYHLSEQISPGRADITWESRYHTGEQISHGREDITWKKRYHLGEQISPARAGMFTCGMYHLGARADIAWESRYKLGEKISLARADIAWEIRYT